MSGPTARLEMQQAGRTFRRYQKLLDDKVLRPIKNIVIADAVARGLIENNAGSRTTKGIFNFGANVSIDLSRDSQSAISEFKSGLRTAADIYSERGQDFESAMRQRAIEAKLIKDLSGEYEVSADTISDIAMQGLQRESQVQTAQRPTDQPQGQGDDADMLGGASLNGAQVSSLINIINAVAIGAVSKEGAISIITAAFPTISQDQARAIIAGVNIGVTIPTTKEEKQQPPKDDASGGSTPPEPSPDQPTQTGGGDSQKKSSLEILESLDPASIKMLIEGMMGGIELAKYDGIDFTPPQGARDAAKRALEVRETKPPSQRGMTPVGLARARDLQNGVKLSPDTVRRMLSFLARHEVDKKGSTFGEQGRGWQAWNGWGGDAGYSWAKKIVGQMDARDKKTEFVAGRDCGQDEGGTFGSSNKCAVGYGRPPLKGGYTPTRPGGKIPSDYKRPTPQGDKKEKAEPQKPLAPSPKETGVLDKYKYDNKNSADVSEEDHVKAIKDAYTKTNAYEDDKRQSTSEEKQIVDDYRGNAGAPWIAYERLKESGMSENDAFNKIISEPSMTSGKAQLLEDISGDTFSDNDMKSIRKYISSGDSEKLNPYIAKAKEAVDKRIGEFNKITNSNFKSEQTIYRGFRADSSQSKPILDQILKGDKNIKFDSFMSASSDPEVAAKYANRSGDKAKNGDSILFKIKAKRGISTINSKRPALDSSFKEVVLPRGKYRVTSQRTLTTGKSKTHFVEIEQI